VRQLDCRLAGEIVTCGPPGLWPHLHLETANRVIDLIGLHFLSDFKKDVELIVLGQPARPHALQSPLTRFTFLPGDRCRP
jgi:hypothetical protein